MVVIWLMCLLREKDFTVETVKFLDQLLQGLEATWANHIVHRDIKPQYYGEEEW